MSIASHPPRFPTWNDPTAAGLDAPQLLLYRSNLLGSDLRITNYGGGNTSAKIWQTDPLSGESVEVLWVKGSGGDVGSMKLDGFATLWMDKLRGLKKLYRGLAHEDSMVDYLPHCTFMATHGRPVTLDANRDELLNVSVEGQSVPTGRFMGGREYAVLAGDASPALADTEHLLQLLEGGWRATPSFCDAGGPFAGQTGKVWQHDHAVALEDVPLHLRAALAAWYAAETSVHIIRHLSAGQATPVVLEGPLSYNEAYVAAMAALLDKYAVWRSTDELEGTARGAWMLAQWHTRQSFQTGLSLVQPNASVQHLLATCYEPNAAFPHPRVSSFARPWQSS